MTTQLTEHGLSVFLDNSSSLTLGKEVKLILDTGEHKAEVTAIVINITESRRGENRLHSLEITDFGNDLYEYWEILYDRIPSLPQTLKRDLGLISHLWQNIAHRIARTRL